MENSLESPAEFVRTRLEPIKIKPRDDYSNARPAENKSSGLLDLQMVPDHAIQRTVDVERIDADESRPARKTIRMKCFECNRPEGHHLAARSRWFYSFSVGMTFGLILLVGPFQCQCCGSSRLMARNELNLRYWMRVIRDRRSSVD